MHFRILKMIATSGFLTVLECTKFDSGPGLRPGPHWGSLQRSPDSLAGLRGLLLRGGEGKARERRGGEAGEEVGRDREREDISEGKGEGRE